MTAEKIKIDLLKRLKAENEQHINRLNKDLERNIDVFNKIYLYDCGFLAALKVQNKCYKNEILYLEGKREFPF